MFKYLTLLFILVSCQQKGKVESQQIIEPTKSIQNSNIIKKRFLPEGIEELKLFESKYESKWENKPEQFPYSTNFKKIKVYELDCSGECFKSEFSKRISKGIEISRNDFNTLLNLLKNPKSYNRSVAACFDPKFGLVVYDKENVPLEFLSICLNCNNFRTYPGEININFENERLYGFSKETRNKLRELFFRWKIDYYGYSEFIDDSLEYIEYLNKKNQLN